MSIRRRWIATCDEPGCLTYYVMEEMNNTNVSDRALLVTQIEDGGWDARPGQKAIYCPQHTSEAQR